MKKCIYRKLNAISYCFYCNKMTSGTLTFPDKSEVWCCEEDAAIHGKIRKFKHLSPVKHSQSKIDQFSCVNSEQNTKLEASTKITSKESPTTPQIKTALELLQEERQNDTN